MYSFNPIEYIKKAFLLLALYENRACGGMTAPEDTIGKARVIKIIVSLKRVNTKDYTLRTEAYSFPTWVGISSLVNSYLSDGPYY